VSVNVATNQSYQQLRPYLFSVAYRMTGSASDAEDLVQDAWIRYMDAGEPAVDSLRAYLTTIVSRLSLDYLKSARVKREQYVGTWIPEPVLTADAVEGPAETVEQREAVSLALLTLMERLTPEQRIVYVLREGFGLAYEEIAAHLDKSAATCRQTFRRAQLLMTDQRPRSIAPADDHRQLIEGFLDAFSQGDAARVASLLAEDVTWISDGGPNRLANRRSIIGRDKVSRGLSGLAAKVPPETWITTATIDLNGAPAIAVFDQGALDRVFAIDTAEGEITGIRVLINPDKLAYLARALGTEPTWVSPYALPRER
jgi:RNA polymerase sigma-70 factor (ECF subfamily)